MRRLLFLSLLCCQLNAEALNEIHVRANDVSHEDKLTTLTGEVVIENAEMRITSDVGYLQPDPSQKSNDPLAVLRLEGNVKIALPDGSLLQSEYAEFNRAEQTAFFSTQNSSNPADHVIYRHVTAADGSSSPIEVHSKNLEVGLEQKGRGIKTLKADSDVHIQYNETYSARADHAHFTPNRDSTKTGTGTLHLEPRDAQICEINTVHGDSVQASEIEIDGATETLKFKSPVGELRMVQEDGPVERVNFSSDHLNWKDKERELTLNGDVRVQRSGGGDLESDKEITVRLHPTEQKLEQIKARGKTLLTHVDPETGEARKLTCYGDINVDNQELRTELSSPSLEGRVPEALQIVYEDRMGKMLADRATLWYQERETGNLDLDKLVVEGNVQIINTAPWDPQDTRPVKQFALADRADYDTDTGKLLLSSLPESRVLFYDQVDDFQVSAPAVVAYRDRQTGKDSVQGQGDVRFTLMKHELEQIQTIFRLHDAASTHHAQHQSIEQTLER